MLGSESSTSFSLSGAKVPGDESSRERKFQGAKAPPMELSLPGAKVHGNESSIIRLSACLSVCLGRCLSVIVCICSNFSCVSLCLLTDKLQVMGDPYFQALCLFLSACLSLSVSVCLPLCLSVCVSLCLFVCLCVCLSVYDTVCPSLSVSLPFSSLLFSEIVEICEFSWSSRFATKINRN